MCKLSGQLTKTKELLLNTLRDCMFGPCTTKEELYSIKLSGHRFGGQNENNIACSISTNE